MVLKYLDLVLQNAINIQENLNILFTIMTRTNIFIASKTITKKYKENSKKIIRTNISRRIHVNIYINVQGVCFRGV